VIYQRITSQKTVIYGKETFVKHVWGPRRLTTLWASTASYWNSFTFTPFLCNQWSTVASGRTGLKDIREDRQTARAALCGGESESERLNTATVGVPPVINHTLLRQYSPVPPINIRERQEMVSSGMEIEVMNSDTGLATG
jgi:hypothetical protein